MSRYAPNSVVAAEGVRVVTTQVTLRPESSAAGVARRWVKRELTLRSRSELLDSAVLGVSELVTNALLHVRGLINVRIVDTDDRLVIEVHDNSTSPPDDQSTTVAAKANHPSTIGRGLQIVDSISSAWGVAYADAGKCVWFAPSPGGSTNGTQGQVLRERPPHEAIHAAGDGVKIELIDLPLQLLIHYRIRFGDLRRELTLIALDAEERTSVAGRLTAVARRLDSYADVGVDSERDIAHAIDDGLDRMTVRYELPRGAVQGIIELRNALTEADAFCRERRMLTLAAGPQENALRAWYLGELIAQAEGAAPTPWPGAFVVTDP